MVASWQTRALVLVTFISLGSLIKILQHGARDLRYNFLCPIVVISLAKLACSVGLYAAYDGPLASLPRGLGSARGIVLRYSAVAALYCAYDVLSFVNLSLFDPQTYLVFLQLRTVGTGVIWEIAFKKPLAPVQRVGLVLICAGCIWKQAKGFSRESSGSVPLLRYASLALQIVANCLAGVANELLLKEKGGACLNLQNIIQYSWTVIWCLLVGVICPVEGIKLNPFDAQEWAKMLDARMLPNIVVLTILGLVTSVLLKVLDSVWKAIATSVELFLTSYASTLIFGYPVSITDFGALCVATGGIWLYLTSAGALPSKEDAEEDAEALVTVVGKEDAEDEEEEALVTVVGKEDAEAVVSE